MSRFKGNNELKNVLGTIPTKERIVESRNLPEFVEEIDVSADDIIDALLERGEFEEDISE